MEQIGRYRILSELGRGAMGIVYKAQDPTIGRLVAIKTIRLGELAHPEEREQLRSRLFREAQSAGMLSHPGIVTIYDIAEENNLAFITMEFVEGRTLEKILESGAITDAADLVSIATQTALALDYAHSKGIVHRDIKPGNIMVNTEGTVKITDFGIARIASSKFTHTGTVMGTPAYMSPEQVRGATVDGRSDMFSLAVVLYEMLTGQKPFTGDSITTVIFKIVSENPTPVKELNPSVGNKMNAAIMRALAKEPAERYQSCRQFAEAVEAAATQTTKLTPTVRKVTQDEEASLRTRPNVAPEPAPVPEPTADEFDQARTIAAKKLPPLDIPAAPELLAPTMRTAEARPRGRPWLPVAAVAVLAAASLAFWQRDRFLGAPADTTSAVEEPAAAVRQPASAQDITPSAAAPQPPPTEPKSATPTSSLPPPSATPSRPVVEAPAKAPSGELYIQINTTEAGAQAVVNGVDAAACTTPCSIPVSRGRHTVVLTQQGRYAERREVQISREPAELTVTMRPILGELLIATVPVGAAITIDGKAAGVTPLGSSVKLPLGRHVIVASKDGFGPAERTVDVTDDSLVTIRFDLEPR